MINTLSTSAQSKIDQVGALVFLERVGERAPEMRERVIDLICRFLRISVAASGETGAAARELSITAQEFLIDHLAHDSPYSQHKTFWPIRQVNLSGTVLNGLKFGSADVNTVHFNGTIFQDGAFFASARFGGAHFAGAAFDGPASFRSARLEDVEFTEAAFRAAANFSQARFCGGIDFTGASFAETPSFDHAAS